MGWADQLTTFEVGGSIIGNGEFFTVIAGPCLAESESLCDQIAEHLVSLKAKLGFKLIFKASFDKANRTSGNSVRGAGIQEGLAILERIKLTYGVPVTTDLHLPDQAAILGPIVDLLQIPAFLCRQTDLLAAAAATKRPVNVKKGQFLSPQDTLNIVQKLKEFHAPGIMLTERGTTFGYNTLVVDMPGLEIMRGFGVPVCFDATHSAQRPGGAGTSTAGARETIPAMVRAACAVGIDCLFLETHPDPANALSDSATQWPLEQTEALIRKAMEISRLSPVSSLA